MTQLKVYKIKFKGENKPSELGKYQVEGDRPTLLNSLGYNKLLDLVEDLYENNNTLGLKDWKISFEKPLDIEKYGDGLLIAKNLNCLEKFILKKDLIFNLHVLKNH